MACHMLVSFIPTAGEMREVMGYTCDPPHFILGLKSGGEGHCSKNKLQTHLLNFLLPPFLPP